MKGEQMELLTWERPTAILLHFPVEREVCLVREAARQLDRRHGSAAEKYWRTECNRLYGLLQARGMGTSDIDAAIDRFARAVRLELELHYWPQRQPDGGDAA
ncbi:DUF6074 family protein [Aureimonas altamirensis]|uniref:DUF6074 family protein n=1 Tax=Aureimonas altamirensis TaxID=370622 RepID=UPI003D157259